MMPDTTPPRRQPRYRDAGIVMLVSAGIGALLGLDMLAQAVDAPEVSNEMIAWSLVLIEAALLVAVVGWRMLQRAKKGADAL
jgi:hypothetical protein